MIWLFDTDTLGYPVSRSHGSERNYIALLFGLKIE